MIDETTLKIFGDAMRRGWDVVLVFGRRHRPRGRDPRNTIA